MRRFALVFAVALSCKVGTGPAGPPKDGAAATASKPDPALLAMADRIDPGPQPPMVEVLPTWLKSKIETQIAGDPAAPEQVKQAREAIIAFDKLPASDTQAMLRGAVVLAIGLVRAERAVAAGSSDPELLAALARAYRLVHQLEMFQRNGLFGQMLALAAEFAQKEGGVEGQQIEEGIAALKQAVARAPGLHMHATAELLRTHPNHPTVSDALTRASQAKVDGEDFALGLELRKLAVARMGAKATGKDHVGLANVCYMALDLECGDLAKKTALKLGPGEAGEDKAAAFKKSLDGVDGYAELARKVIALQAATGLEDRLERGHVLLKLNHLREAGQVFTALRDQFPKDARPRTALAVLALRQSLDYQSAAENIRAARGLAGRDRQYYEVGLGTVPLMAIGDITTAMARGGEKSEAAVLAGLAPLFDELQAMAKEYAQFDPPRAALLERLFVLAKEAVPKFSGKSPEAGMALVRSLPEEALALIKRFPESADAWRMLYSMIRLTADVKRARELMATPLPPLLQQDPDVRLQQVRALIDLALSWEDRQWLVEAARVADELPAGVDADTAKTVRATIDAVLGFQGDAAALKRAQEAFTELAARKTGKDQAMPLNNAGLIQAFTGDVEGAFKTLGKVMEADPEAITAGLNMAGLAFNLQQREGLAELFAAVAEKSKIAAARVHAHAYLAAMAEAGHGDVKVTREEFAAALKKEVEGDFRGRFLSGRWGVGEHGEFKLSLGWTTNSGLVLYDEVVPVWWLFVPAPNFDALAAAVWPAATNGKSGKPGDKSGGKSRKPAR